MHSLVYDATFYENMEEGSLRSAKAIVSIITGLINPASVVDVGCGLGVWLSVFKEVVGDDVLGLDGKYVELSKLHIPKEKFLPTDLSKPFSIDRKFDLAISLEVGEHLPSESASDFIASLCRLAPIILFSAAAPYQGGTNHVNEQWPNYWQKLFLQQSYIMFDPIRPLVWYDERVDWPYKQNIFLLIRSDLVESNITFQKLPRVHEHSLMLVTPWVLNANLGLKASLIRLPSLVRRAFLRRIITLKQIISK